MAYKINKDKAALIASEYTSNGNDAIKAIQSAGYKYNYARNYYKKIMQDIAIVDAINKIKAMNAVNTEYTRQFIQNEHRRLQLIAEEKGDISQATANLIGLGKTIAVYSDNVNNFNADKPLEIEEDDRQELMQAAIKLTKTG